MSVYFNKASPDNKEFTCGGCQRRIVAGRFNIRVTGDRSGGGAVKYCSSRCALGSKGVMGSEAKQEIGKWVADRPPRRDAATDPPRIPTGRQEHNHADDCAVDAGTRAMREAADYYGADSPVDLPPEGRPVNGESACPHCGGTIEVTIAFTRVPGGEG